MSVRHASFIAGEARAGERGFELVAADGAALGAWPRATQAEVESAARAARAASGAWAARPRAEREALGRALLEALADEPDPERLLARRLGLDELELRALHALETEESRALLAGEEDEDDDALLAGRPELVRPHWSCLWSGLVAPARAALARGGALLVLADARAPMLGDALAGAARRARLPDGLVQVVHDDRADALASLAGALPEARVRVSGPEEELERAAERLERVLRASGAPGFGAGVRAGGAWLAPRLEPLASGERRVGLADDPLAAAHEIARDAFARLPALGGQRPGRPRRVLVDERCFSRFSAGLLEALAALEGAPVPLLEAADPAWLARMRELGLDEGATLLVDAVAAASAGSGGGSSGARRPDSLFGLVFTNVEPDLRLARLTRPAPLLCLVRVPVARAPGPDLDGRARPAPGREPGHEPDHEGAPAPGRDQAAAGDLPMEPRP